MIEFNKRITVSVVGTEVERRGQLGIRGLLCHLPPLPEEWNWSRLIQEGEFRGKIPKRIASYYKKVYQEKISPRLLEKIGDRVGRYSFDGKTYILDFDDKLDWNAGDFGDHGSCFWDFRMLARDALVLNNVIAVRFYRQEGGGYARALILEMEDGLIVFNAYGLPCKLISYILATFFDYPHRGSIDFFIQEDIDGLIWLNNDAYQISHNPLEDEHKVKFDVPYALCIECEEFFSVDNGNFIQDDRFLCYQCL